MKARTLSDDANRESIREKVKLCIDTLDPESHPPTIVSIVCGEVADETVDVQGAVKISTGIMQEFEKNLPEGVRSTNTKKIKTGPDSRKHIKDGSQKIP